MGVLEALAAAAEITWGGREEGRDDFVAWTIVPWAETAGPVFKSLLLFCVFRSNLENAIMSTSFSRSLGVLSGGP